MTYDPNQKRGGPANAGNWTKYENSDPESALTAPKRRNLRVSVAFNYEMDTSTMKPLPEYPAALPHPVLSMDMEDGAQTYLTVGDDTVIFWSRQTDYEGEQIFNSETDGENGDLTHIDEETREALLEWGSVVQHRVSQHAHSLGDRASSDPRVQAVILASATDDTTYDPFDENVPAPERAVARAQRNLSAWAETDLLPGEENAEVNAERLQDVYSDMRHFALKNGIDFEEDVAARGDFIFNDELENP